MIDYEAIREELEREEKVDSASEYLEKVNRIKKEKNRLKRTLKEIDKSKKSAVESAINDVAFMAVMMEDLRETLSEMVRQLSIKTVRISLERSRVRMLSYIFSSHKSTRRQ